MNNGEKKIYDLEERTAVFGENTIEFCKTLNLDTISRPLVSQLIKSATSMGANYMEANGASSKKDFRNKIHICKKEAQETKHWLRMLSVCLSSKKGDIDLLSKESRELILIFAKIAKSSADTEPSEL